MTTSAIRSLLQIGRRLRYRQLPIVRQRVVIETLDDVEHVLRQLVTPWITRDSQWEGCNILGGLAKYGILDRWCNVDPRELDGGIGGIAALRANGFRREEPDPDPKLEAEAREMTDAFLADYAREIGGCVLKVFLEDGLANDLRFLHNSARYRARLAPELLPNYFPRPFVVIDACITNAPWIWSAKHFYL